MEKRTKELNGREYQILIPPVIPAQKICARTSALLLPVLGSLGQEAKEGGWSKFSAALSGADPDKVNTLLMDTAFLSKLHCDGQPVCTNTDFERHFTDCRADVFIILGWCLWEVVKDFFPQLGAFTQIAKAAMEKVSQFPQGGKTTTG